MIVFFAEGTPPHQASSGVQLTYGWIAIAASRSRELVHSPIAVVAPTALLSRSQSQSRSQKFLLHNKAHFLPSQANTTRRTRTYKMATSLTAIPTSGDGPSPPRPVSSSLPAFQPPRLDFVAIQAAIFLACTVHDFVRIYDGSTFQLCLRYLVVSSGNYDLTVWASAWAMRMRDEPQNDFYLNQCRKTVLSLLFEMLNRWRDGTIAAADIVCTFTAHRLVNILHYCLPLDRAQCLLKMQYPVMTVEPGMHWVSESHVADSAEWQDRLARVGGRPTMNKRYLWLLHDPAFAELGLNRNTTLMRLVEPCICRTIKPRAAPLDKAANRSSETAGEDWTVVDKL
jgi:hypothetical protein